MGFTIRANRLQVDGRAVDFIKSPYVGGSLPTPTPILVMHFTYGASAYSSAKWFQSPNNTGSSAHVVIERDGVVIQCVPFDVVAWHAGRSRLRNIVGLNRHALGIELANWGYLRPAGAGWQSYTKVPIADPFLGIHKNGNPDGNRGPIGWEPYPEAQFTSAVALARLLVSTYGVTEIVGHDDISAGWKWDPGPAFDMIRFRSLVFGGRADDGDIRRTVGVAEGLNLRTGPGVSHPAVRLLPQGTEVEPIERDGHWLSVSVINANGDPTATGWVHERYLD